MLQVYRKIHRFCDVIYYFTNGRWHFTNQNVQQMWKKLTPQDQQLFFFNMGELNWSEVINLSIFGIRTYLMKEDPNNIPEALKRTQRWVLLACLPKSMAIAATRLWLLFLLCYFATKNQITCKLKLTLLIGFLFICVSFRWLYRLKILHFAVVYSIYTAIMYFVYMLLSKFFLPALSASTQI